MASDPEQRTFPVPSWRRKRRALTPTLTAADFLDAYAEAFGDRPVLLLDRVPTFAGARPDRLTYGELRDHAGRIASVYRDLGLGHGDAVAFLTLNRVELAVAVLGALRAGLTVVPLSYLLTPSEIAAALDGSGAQALVADRDTVEALGVAAAGMKHILLLDRDAPEPMLSLPELAERAEVSAPTPVDDERTALIFFTSGTTGEPKGAAIPHRALSSVIRRQARITAMLPTPRRQLALLVMPLAHTGGFIMMVITACLAVPSLVLSRFDAPGVLATIEQERPTIFAGSPAMYRMLLDAGAEGYDLSSIRVWGGGADVFDRTLLDRLRRLGGWKRFGIRLKPFTVVGYGASETTGQVTFSPPLPVGDRCIGWVLPGFDVRIVDDAGNDVRRGTGELWLRGGSLMSGYWDDEEGTEAAFERGWFRTGDIVRRGAFGLLYFESRRKDVIKSGGYSIAAREIEQVLESHPSVDLAAAVGLPDAVKGERPVAAVVLRRGTQATTDELVSWAAERLAPYKRPRRVHIVASLPVSATMKPKKPEIRALLLDEAGP